MICFLLIYKQLYILFINYLYALFSIKNLLWPNENYKIINLKIHYNFMTNVPDNKINGRTR